MKYNLRNWMTVVLVTLCVLTVCAGTTVKKTMPRIEDDEKLITLPGRVYYFDNGELHCYDLKRGEDSRIEGYDGLGSRWRIFTPWYDSASDCVFFIENGGGMEIDYQTVYQVSGNHKALPMITLTGRNGEVDIDVTDDYIYLDGWVDELAPVNLPGVTKGQPLSKIYSTGLKPWKFTRHSMESLKKPNLSLYSITAPGVNVRGYRDPKAPRLGYFKPRPGFEEEGYWLQPEDADIDTYVFTRAFMPWHPEQGAVFASSEESYDPEGWTKIVVDDLSYEPVVSSKFVRQMDRDPLVSVEQIADKELRNRVHKMSSTNYPGVWLMIDELPDCGEAPLMMGKEIDGMVIFKWILGWPFCSSEKSKRIHIDENNFVSFGEELIKNGYELDLSKINDNDLETLLKVAEPIRSAVPILVNIHEKEVRTFRLPKL